MFDEWEEGARVLLDWGDVANSVYSLWNNGVFAEKVLYYTTIIRIYYYYTTILLYY